MTTLLHDPTFVQVIEPCPVPCPEPAPSAADAAWWARRSAPPTADPPTGPTLPTSEWLKVQASWLRSHGDPLMDLAADRVADLAITFAFHRTQAVGDLLANPFTRYHGADLDTLAVDEARANHRADLLDEQAAYYLRMDSDLARLVAWDLVRLADEFEAFGSGSVEEYELDRTAWEDAQIDAMFEDQDHDCELPLF